MARQQDKPQTFNDILSKPLTNHRVDIHLESVSEDIAASASRYLVKLFGSATLTTASTFDKSSGSPYFTYVISTYVKDSEWTTANIERVFKRVALIASIAAKPGFLIVIDNAYGYFQRANDDN